VVDFNKVLDVQQARREKVDDLSWVFDSIAMHVLPPSWRIAEVVEDGVKYVKTQQIIRRQHKSKRKICATIIVSGAIEDDGRRWLHMSMSMVKRIPTCLRGERKGDPDHPTTERIREHSPTRLAPIRLPR
jgi:hypothetical protein